MFHLIKSYLSFILKAKNEHGVHSPFVFDLVCKCFYDLTKYPEYDALDEYRTSLLNNHTTIDVTNFDADSQAIKSNTREIATIAKNVGISRKRAQLLFRLVRYFQPKEILEIGTSLGLATSALALGNNRGKIISLDACPSTQNQCQLHLQKFNINRVNYITTEFSSFLNNIDFTTSTFDFIYFHSNHSKRATLEYFETLLPTITNETIWIFDDIHRVKEKEEAWQIIKNHPKVTVSIDTYQFGLVFFRKEQNKEHFYIKTEQNLSSKFFEKIRI